MPAGRCCEFVDSRLRRSPPDRASAVPYGQAGENAMRFPHLAHRSAAAHKLHRTPQQHRMNLISGNDQTSSRLPAFSLFAPEAVQTIGTTAVRSAGHHLLGGEDTILNQTAYLVIDDTEFAGGLRHCQPFASLLGRTVGMNAVHPAHRTDT